jgi:arginase
MCSGDIMITVLYFPQWQGGASVHALIPSAAHLRTRLLTHAGDTPIREIDVTIRPDEGLTVETNIAYRATILQQLHEAQAKLREAAPSHFVTIGGDCGIETVPVSYANALAQGQMALVFIDAHGDLNTPQTSPSQHYHGMSLRTLLGEGDDEFVAMVGQRLTPQQVFMVGVRELDPAEEDFLTEHQVYRTLRPDVPGLMAAIKQRGFTHVYVHFDMDGLDPDVFPYTSYKPTSGGLTIEEVTEILAALRQNFNVIGISMTEFASESGEGVDLLDPVLAQVALIGRG